MNSTWICGITLPSKALAGAALGLAMLVASPTAWAADSEVRAKAPPGSLGAGLPLETALLTDAPEVPPFIGRLHPAKVVVNLEVTEVTKRLADGVDYTFWTFGGNVPGKFIRV